MLLGVALGGCVGLTAGGAVGVSQSNQGRRGVFVEAPLGMATRSMRTTTDDRARLWFLTLVPRLRYDASGHAFDGGGVLLGGGVGEFRDRWGGLAMVTMGAVFDGDEVGHLSVRLQAGLERELGRSDWRVSVTDTPCAGQAHSHVPAVSRHTTVGLLPGLEFLGGDRREWIGSLAVTVRGLFEPGC